MAAFSYSYRIPGLMKASAEVAGKECQRLQDSVEGLTPETLLDASRSEKAPLHDEFEWRDDVAAERFRLRQAQDIIRNIVIVECKDGEATTKVDRAFVSTPGGRSIYVSLQSAITNDDWRNHLLAEARRELGWFAQKYRRIKELAGVVQEIDKVLNTEERVG